MFCAVTSAHSKMFLAQPELATRFQCGICYLDKDMVMEAKKTSKKRASYFTHKSNGRRNTTDKELTLLHPPLASDLVSYRMLSVDLRKVSHSSQKHSSGTLSAHAIIHMYSQKMHFHLCNPDILVDRPSTRRGASKRHVLPSKGITPFAQ